VTVRSSLVSLRHTLLFLLGTGLGGTLGALLLRHFDG